ncbi:alpha/beta fold hydrolase [Microtetraspora sp. AC03309]|uniref:alpha/beta fold hydrolase n=1 Tax=Microtetraspora sp. AC03309 TaxID=2779376 RepID=UPI001E353713|nr:alpha/beta fold hydrolase [Microtetraspora sp. AC03309]MCC5576381.1 alpha/beta fold hydrolase [Microtetraspora sp. AC03309]
MSVSYHRSGLVFTEHTITVPLDHSRPDGASIEVFAREAVAAGRQNEDLPWLLYLEGGPGYSAPRAPKAWLSRAAREYRVLLLDQRGTGRSTPANRKTLAAIDDPAVYLRHFRADSIVRDAEALRAHLAGDRPWSVLGQSYGGFCALTYLSLAPEGLREVMIAGGLPSLTASPADVYRATYPRVLAQNERYFARYPGDVAAARRVADHLRWREEFLPGGERLSARRFQTLGLAFGLASSFDTLHDVLEEAFVNEKELSDTFLRRVDAMVSYAERPLYALLHEAAYCQGEASGWAAHNALGEFPEFDLELGGPVRFFGEMIFPWFFAEDPALVPLRDCAEALAAHRSWPRLYDLDRLDGNTVPVAAAIYHDDMYMDRDHSLRTAGMVRELAHWITNEHTHDALGVAGGDVLDRLITMVRR